MELLFRSPWRAGLILTTFTLLVRANVMGDPGYHLDESFFLLVAQRLHDGDRLYVDIWDRKPPGIYLIYYAISGAAPGMLPIHLAAAISTAIAAFLIYRLSRLLCGPRGAALAALAYVAMIGRFGGAGGQTPVFYTTLMLGAGWLVASRARDLSRGRVPPAIYLAMGLAGSAIAVKPVALAEAAFMGLWVILQLRRTVPSGRLVLRACGLAASGALPILACLGWFAANGQFAPTWDAAILSNFRRHYMLAESRAVLGALAAQLALPASLGAMAAWFGRKRLAAEPSWQFVCLWTLVALAAFLAFPNKADHYVIPLLAPLAICAAPFLDRRDLGFVVGLYLVAAFLVTGDTFTFRDRAASRREMAAAVQFIRQHDPHPRLLVYAGSPYLYYALNARPLSPLAFPPHLFDRTERDVSIFPTASEVRHILAARPTTVAIQEPILTYAENRDLSALVHQYVEAHCSVRTQMTMHDMYGPYRIGIYSRCDRG